MLFSIKNHAKGSVMLLTLCALFSISFSCDRESLAEDVEVVAQEEQQVNVFPTLEELPLSELSISVVDGVPTYRSTPHFLQVNKAIGLASEAEYLRWSEEQGFSAPYHDYLKLAERIEANPDVPSPEQVSEEEGTFIFHMDGGGVAINPYVPVTKMTDQEGRLYIGDDIHSFRPDYHILIDGGDELVLAEVMNNPVTDLEKGILVQPTTNLGNPYEEQKPFQPGQKVQVENLSCPLEFSDSDDPARNFFNRYDAYLARAAIFREDEQEVGCSRRRCRRRTWTFLLSNTFPTQLSPTTFESVSLVNYAFNNQRRNRFNWTRTFPEVVVDNGAIGRQMRIRIEGFVLTQTQQIQRVNVIGNIAYPGQLLDSNGSPRGTAQEDIALQSVGFETSFGVGGVVGFRTEQTIESGDVRHRWTTGCNNCAGDPISVEYRCQ